jgi:fibronectin type 3 domain-containing protein
MRLDIRRSSSHPFVATLFFAALALLPTACGRNRAADQDGRPGHHSVTLTWAASTTPVVGYNVYRATPPNGPYSKLNSEPIMTTHYTDTRVEPGHTYTYHVTAVDGKKLESAATTDVTAMVPSP